MRAIAALMIVLHHVAWKVETYSTDSLDWFHVGRAGVDLFFVISGYIMCHVTHERRVNILSFIMARVRRIIPLYWFLSTCALIIYLLVPEKINSSGGTTDIINSFTLWPSEHKYLINNGWTLTYEFYFYLLFSVALYCVSTYRYFIPTIIISLLVITGLIWQPLGPALSVATSPLLLEFLFGIIIFYSRKRIFRSVYLAKLLILAAILILVFVNNTDWWHSRVVCYGIPAALFCIGMLSLEPFFNRIKAHKISILACAVGDSSYSLYLVHPFALVSGAIILSKLGLGQLGSLFSALLVLGSLVAGYLCYWLIEKNLDKIFRRKLAL